MTTDPRIGKRIRLDYTNDPYTNLRPGDEGTVTFVDSLGTVSARWDNGSSLGLCPDMDRFTILDDDPATDILEGRATGYVLQRRTE